MPQLRKEQFNVLSAQLTSYTYTASAGSTSTILPIGFEANTVTQTSGGDPSVPTRGVVTLAPDNYITVKYSDTGLSLSDSTDYIFGRLTYSAPNYTITYYKLNSGTETSATLPGMGSYDITMLFPEVMEYGEVPANASIINVVGAPVPMGTQGAQGFQGDLGTQGPQGYQGVVGTPGSNAAESTYVSAVGDPTVSLLLHMDGANNSTTFTDKGYTRKNVTAYIDAKVSTTNSKFGGASFYSPGTNGSLLDVADSADFAFGTGDFTIETWFNLSALSAGSSGFYSTIFDTRGSSNSGLFFAFNSSSKLIAYTLPGIFFTSIATISTGTWYHLAIVRRNDTFSVYLDGILDSSVDVSGKNLTETNFVIGSNYDYSPFPGVEFNGYMDEFRVTKGLARYTTNFTPATSAFTDADGSAELVSSAVVGQTIYSSDGVYVCSATSPLTWKKYAVAPSTIIF